MAEVQSLRKGNIYEEDNNLWRVLEYQHIKMARGGATIRVKVRNLLTVAQDVDCSTFCCCAIFASITTATTACCGDD